MILKDRLSILDELMQSAQQILEQYKSFASVASEALTRAEAFMALSTTSPNDVLAMFNKIHDMQMQSLATINTVLEKFPVEHTIQELQLLELYRNLTERQKQQFMSSLETLVLQKRQR